METFQYEWWTVKIKSQCGDCVLEVKAKSKENAIKQINKEVKYTNSEKNQNQDYWHRKARILEVYWETLTLDRVGYQRLY